MGSYCPSCEGFYTSKLCTEPGCGGFVCSQCQRCQRDHDHPGTWVNFAPDT
jgi:hypothetical protein